MFSASVGLQIAVCCRPLPWSRRCDICGESGIRRYRTDQQLVVFADDIVPRRVSASCVLDYDEVGLGVNQTGQEVEV